MTFIGGTPLAVATQIGAGAFTGTTPSNKVTFNIPGGNTKFAIAFVCPPVAESTTTFNSEVVVEATVQDGTDLTENCFAPPSTGTASGNVSSGFSSTTEMIVVGAQSSNVTVGSASGPFSLPMPVGPNDVAVLALDGSQNILGVKIVRAQTVPGTVGGSGIVLLPPGDAVTTQSVTITNVPAGFGAPSALVLYHTANGTSFGLRDGSLTNPTPYAVVPPASTQTGDFYQYFTSIASTTNQLIGAGMTTTSGGGAVTLGLPTPWSFAGPTPAKLPTFTFNYAGFSGLPTSEELALITWPVGSTTTDQIEVTATANFQNGATTITIPDLSSIPGFLALAPSGTTVGWLAVILGGNPQTVLTLTSPPANASAAFVQTGGQFTQP